jgi:hypothetical protein
LQIAGRPFVLPPSTAVSRPFDGHLSRLLPLERRQLFESRKLQLARDNSRVAFVFVQ